MSLYSMFHLEYPKFQDLYPGVLYDGTPLEGQPKTSWNPGESFQAFEKKGTLKNVRSQEGYDQFWKDLESTDIKASSLDRCCYDRAFAQGYRLACEEAGETFQLPLIK